VTAVSSFRVAEAAGLLGVSDDTLRRWVDGGRVASSTDAAGRAVVAGVDLAALAAELAAGGPPGPGGRPARAHSARNRLPGLVTRVRRDDVMAQVDIQAGPHRVVSLISREAADELGLEPGVLVVATVKATSVGVELPVR